MHTKKLFVFGIIFVMTFSAMSIVGGDTGDNSANSSDGPQPLQGTTPRTVLVEEFTATWCPPCNTLAPALNRIADEYSEDDFIMLAWHPASSEVGSVVASDRGVYYGWYWLPTGVIDGGGTYTDDTLWRIGATGGTTGSYTDYRAMIDAQLAKPTNLKIDMWGSIEGNKANILTRIEATDPVPQTNLKAYFTIAEDDLYSTNGEQTGRTPYWRHVVRDYGSQPFSISEGEVVYLTQSFNIQPSWQPERLGAVVFVQTDVISGTWTDGSSDYYNREILQAAGMDFIHDSILVVNDIYNPDPTWLFSNPPMQKLMSYNKFSFDNWDSLTASDTGGSNYKNLPTLSDLEKYSTVVWFTDTRPTTLNASERASLESYLDTGSNLFITGSNIGSDLDAADPVFLSDYLHSTFTSNNAGENQLLGTAGDPISDSYSESVLHNLKYIKWNGASWDQETVDFVGESGLYSSMALDSLDYQHISYYDESTSDLKYTNWTGSSWSIQTIESAGDVGMYTSIALDNNDYPHISYYDNTNSDLKYANWTGSAWNIEIVDSVDDVGNWTSIELDSNYYSHISYYNTTSGDLKHANWTGTSWSIETVDSADDVGQYTAITLDNNDYPHISYYDNTNNDLKYANWTGSIWDIQTVESLTDVGMWSSITLDSNYYPHISYYNATGGDIKYANWDGAVWNISRLEAGGIVGQYTSIALNNSGYPHISYYHYSNKDLRHARWTGTSWFIRTIDSIGDVGKYTSIAIDSNDDPQISYYDGTNLLYVDSATPDAIVPADIWTNTTFRYDPSGQGAAIRSQHDPNSRVVYFGFTFFEDEDSTGPPDLVKVDLLKKVIDWLAYSPPVSNPPVAANITGVTTSLDYKDVTISWNASADDGAGEDDIVKYNIYWGIQYSGPYTYLTSVPATGIPSSTYSWEHIDIGPEPATFFYKIYAEDASEQQTASPEIGVKFYQEVIPGSNLLSFPFNPTDTSLTSVLQMLSYDMVWAYDATDINDPWKSYMEAKPYKGDLWALNSSLGFWVNGTMPGDLIMVGLAPSCMDVPLYTGWNLVSYPVFASDTVASALSGITYDRIEGFDPTAPPTYMSELSGGDMMQSGYGYWIKVDSNQMWTLCN